jgi:hypothetical protein
LKKLEATVEPVAAKEQKPYKASDWTPEECSLYLSYIRKNIPAPEELIVKSRLTDWEAGSRIACLSKEERAQALAELRERYREDNEDNGVYGFDGTEN